jgi:hypothetical protein
LKRLIPIGAGLVFIIGLIGGEVYLRTGRFIYQANTGLYNMAMGFGDDSDGTFNYKVFVKGGAMYIENRDTMDYTAINEIYKERIISHITSNPIKILKQIPNRFLRLYLNETTAMSVFLSDKKMKTGQEMQTESATSTLWTKFPHYERFQYILIIVQLNYYFIMLCFLLGLWKAYKNRESSLIFPFIIICMGTLITMGVISVNRYHYPYMPFIMLFSAYYLSSVNFRWFHRLMRRKKVEQEMA